MESNGKFTLIVFNTCTQEYEEVIVTEEVYRTYCRTRWNIKDNDQSFFCLLYTSRGVTWWLPLTDSFLFQGPLPTDDTVAIATLGGLRKELEKLNQLAWQADEDTILGWADTEGYPVDGTIDSDGQYSKADIPEHTQYDTQSLAKFAFSMFWRAMRFAEEQQVPILLDY